MVRNKSWALCLGSIIVVLLTGCVKSIDVKKPDAPIRSVALVSLSVSNWNQEVRGTAFTMENATRIINSTLGNVLEETEAKLSENFHVVRVATFIGGQDYRALDVKNDLKILLPKVGKQPLAVFVKDNDDLIAAKIPPAVAKRLCASLKVDAVVVVYSEWAIAEGHFVRLRRALAKDVVSVWDRNGNVVFHKRVDTTGSGVLGGGWSPTFVSFESIKQWDGAYLKGFEAIAKEMANLRHS